MRLVTWRTGWLPSRIVLTLWARSMSKPRRSLRRLTGKYRYLQHFSMPLTLLLAKAFALCIAASLHALHAEVPHPCDNSFHLMYPPVPLLCLPAFGCIALVSGVCTVIDSGSCTQVDSGSCTQVDSGSCTQVAQLMRSSSWHKVIHSF